MISSHLVNGQNNKQDLSFEKAHIMRYISRKDKKECDKVK